MKHLTQLLATLSLFAATSANAATPLTIPVTQLEVGKTYIFENARSNDKNSDYRFLCDTDGNGELQCSDLINVSCVWTVEQSQNGDAIHIGNVLSGKYLFTGTPNGSKYVYSSGNPVDLYLSDGKYFEGTLRLSTSPDSKDSFLTSYMDMTYTKYVCIFKGDSGSDWFAYETDCVNYDKVKYIISPQVPHEAIAIGVVSGNFSLEGLEIPDYITYNEHNYPVTTIGDNAFKDISGFSGELRIGKNVKSIEAAAFSGCFGFTSLQLYDGLTTIGNNAFNGCIGFTGSLYIPQSVTTIGNYAFNGCSGFSGSLDLRSVTTIGNYAFNGCSGLTGSLDLWSVTTIGNYAFNDCRGLTGSLKLPDSLMSIGEYAFQYCRFEGALKLPESLVRIEQRAFNYCSGFTGSLELPENLESIGHSAFYGCRGLNGYLVIPATITDLSAGYIFGNTDFEKVICYSSVPPVGNSSLFSGARTNELRVPGDAITAYMLKAPWNEFNNIHSIEPLSGIEFAEANVVCPLGGTVKLKVNKTPFGAEGEISFISGNPAVATVDANGVVTGVAKGSTAIIAMCGTLTATCVVTVEDPTIAATGLEFEGIVGNVGETVTIGAKVLPEDATDPTISWASSNPEVAAVDTEGVVWFNAAGNATVTAECQGHDFSVPFVVKEVMARALNVFPVEAVGGIGHEFSLLALHEPENTTDKSVTWESSDPAVATVSEDGRVSLAALGSAKITARSGEHTAVCSVTVDNTVSLTEMASTGVVIDIVEGGIVIRNAPVGESVAVYAIDGKVVNGAIVESEETRLNLAAGIYIVKVSPETVAKVLIK